MTLSPCEQLDQPVLLALYLSTAFLERMDFSRLFDYVVFCLVADNFLLSPTTFSGQCEGTSVLLHIPYCDSKQFVFVQLPDRIFLEPCSLGACRRP